MSSAPPRTSRLAEWLYAMAYLGAHTGFVPLLVLLLPRRIEAWNAEQSAETLSWLLLVGAITASLAHIAAGHWSDKWHARTGNRRALIVIGAVLLALVYAGLGLARDIYQLAAFVLCFQITLNLMFAPLGALLSDYVPDNRKGAVSGMLNVATPLAYGVIALLARFYPDDSDLAFFAVGALILVLTLPLALVWPFPAASIAAPEPDTGTDAASFKSASLHDFTLAWLARLLIQLGGALIVGYLYLYVSNLKWTLGDPPSSGPSGYVGILSLLALAGTFAIAIAGGCLSDVFRRRLFPMAAFGACAALGLVLMAYAPNWGLVAAAYTLANIGLAGFLAVDGALVAQLLSGNPRRGALLGVMNLTNTIPSIIVPAIALLAIGNRTIAEILPMLLYGAAAASVLAAVLVLQIRLIR